MQEVDHYIAKFPDEVKQRLVQLRAIIIANAPELTESLKWGNPAFSNETIMVIMAGYKHHVSLHATKTVIASLKDKLSGYVTTSGGVQFPVDKPIPEALVKEILACRLKEYKSGGVLWR